MDADCAVREVYAEALYLFQVNVSLREVECIVTSDIRVSNYQYSNNNNNNL